MNIRRIFLLVTGLVCLLNLHAQNTPLKVLAFQNPEEAPSNAEFTQKILTFLEGINGNGELAFEQTADPSRINEKDLKDVNVIIMLGHIPLNNQQQKAFQNFMENGGRWLGFQATAVYAKGNWPWFNEFIGGACLEESCLPALPAKLKTEDPCILYAGEFQAIISPRPTNGTSSPTDFVKIPMYPFCRVWLLNHSPQE